MTIARKTFLRLCALTAALVMAGCVPYGAIQPGMSMTEVEKQLHAPTAKRNESGGEVWEYNLAPEGRATWMVRFGPDGKVRQSEQVLTEENFRNIRNGQTNRDDLLRMFGEPYMRLPFSRMNEEVWDYRYSSNSWFMLISVNLDAGSGIVKSTYTQPDPDRYPGKDSGR